MVSKGIGYYELNGKRVNEKSCSKFCMLLQICVQFVALIMELVASFIIVQTDKIIKYDNGENG